MKNKSKKSDAKIKIINFFPDGDMVRVSIGDWRVDIFRTSDGETHIGVQDMKTETETMLVLGQDGETKKV